MEDMIEVEFVLDRETKNTFRFNEVEAEGEPIKVGTLYVKKWVVPTGVRKMKVLLAFDEPASV